MEGRNPGESQVETAGSYDPENEVLVVLTSPTRYAVDLETRFGGRDAALGPAMHSGAAHRLASAAAAARRVRRGCMGCLLGLCCTSSYNMR